MLQIFARFIKLGNFLFLIFGKVSQKENLVLYDGDCYWWLIAICGFAILDIDKMALLV